MKCLLVLGALLLVPASVTYSGTHPAEKPAEGRVRIEKVALLTTQVFESGELTLGECSAASLELFLQDLNRRKDYDYSQHNGQPGPDSAYLWAWVQKVVGELQTRGYTLDEKGNLFRRDGSAVRLR